LLVFTAQVSNALFMSTIFSCYRSKHIHITEKHLQRYLNKLQNWADTNGFKFSTSKTVCMHFCCLRKLHPEPELLLNGTPIPVVEEVTFLGLIFVRKLSLLPHLRYLKNKCVTSELSVPRHVTRRVVYKRTSTCLSLFFFLLTCVLVGT